MILDKQKNHLFAAKCSSFCCASNMVSVKISSSGPRDAPSTKFNLFAADDMSPGKKFEQASSVCFKMPHSLKALTTSSLQKKARPSSISLI